MAASEKYKPETSWDQTAFEKLKATWTPERIAEDDATLKNIFALAADCPLLAEALDWANTHGIKFFIDHQAVNIGGYYTMGTGVMAVVPKTSLSMEEVMVHEIRHAWQDYHGLVSWDDNTAHDGCFNDFFINNALIEADAKGYGLLAASQARAARRTKEIKAAGLAIPESLSHYQEELLDENAQLGKGFLSWFRSDFQPAAYGDFFSKFYGQKWGLYTGALPERNMEFDLDPPHLRGMDINNIQDVLRLGFNFSGTKNYLAALQPDILPKKILRPSLADTFWGKANMTQRKLTGELRKAHLKKKLAGKKRQP
jgi:hypothetical protein